MPPARRRWPIITGDDRAAGLRVPDRGVLSGGSQSYPLFAQPLDVVEGWAEKFEGVWICLRF